ncbi:MAG: hypothetical protein ACJAVK_001130 [Akkermansiaceae bacterium]|jgi:hypothetical protein
MKNRVTVLAIIFLVIAGLLFLLVGNGNFKMSRPATLPMTIWGVGFLIASSLLLRGKDSE